MHVSVAEGVVGKPAREAASTVSACPVTRTFLPVSKKLFFGILVNYFDCQSLLRSEKWGIFRQCHPGFLGRQGAVNHVEGS